MQAFCTRGLVAAALAVCLSLGAAGTAAASGDDRDRCPNRGVPTDQISVQLWTFAEYIGFGTDAATINRTRTVFDALRGMGYRNVEPFTLSGLTAEQYRNLLREHGLRANSRHVNVGTPTQPVNFDQILAENRTIGIRYFGSGGTPQYKTEAEWIAYARYLNELGARARQAGQQLMVHNHNWEFETRFGDRTAFDILMQYTDRRNVAFQLDLYWVVRGGADPIQVIRRYGDRIQLFHVKDMAPPRPTGRIEIVGRGVIDFPAIFAAAGKNIRYYVVEHDPRFGDPTFDPFEAARDGFRYLSCVDFKKGGSHGGGHHDDDKDKGKGKGNGHDKDKGNGHDKGKGKGHDGDD